MNNFAINTNIALSDFQNSAKNFSVPNVDKSFDEVFNSMGQKPLEGGIEAQQNPSDISAVAKMASDIGSGFKNSINELNTVQRAAETDFETFASGGDISIHDVMISAQKSNLSMQMAIQLRNQMINAYNEFKNMAL